MINIKPVVFSVGNDYQIAVPVEKESVMWVNVNGNDYFDESNGILRSDVLVHKMTVPKDELDKCGQYTINYRIVIERKAYFSQTEDVVSKTFDFMPAKKENIRIFHLADCHDNYIKPIKSAEAFGNIDLLILNGDIHENSGEEKRFLNIFKIAWEITGGKIPVVYARGNHDTRGKYAEKLELYMPTDKGNSFYTFTIGDVWGLVLDCGEDKLDSHIEYGNTICCEAFRKRETQFLKNIVENASKEYNADGIKHRFVVSHIPFTQRKEEEFDIENDIYNEWVRLLNEEIKPEFLLCGHTHSCEVIEPGTKGDHRGQKFTTIKGAETVNTYSENEDEKHYIGAGIEFKRECTVVSFADNEGKTNTYTVR